MPRCCSSLHWYSGALQQARPAHWGSCDWSCSGGGLLCPGHCLAVAVSFPVCIPYPCLTPSPRIQPAADLGTVAGASPPGPSLPVESSRAGLTSARCPWHLLCVVGTAAAFGISLQSDKPVGATFAAAPSLAGGRGGQAASAGLSGASLALWRCAKSSPLSLVLRRAPAACALPPAAGDLGQVPP